MTEELAARPLWLNLKALITALHTNEGVDARYRERLRRATLAREALALRLQVMDMLIANPAANSKVLAGRIGKSATWFNDIVRETFEALDV